MYSALASFASWGRTVRRAEFMALFPCDIHLGRYKGPASAAYPAVMVGRDSRRRKLRCCEPCLTAKIEESPVKLLLVDPDGPPDQLQSDGSGCTTHSELEPVGSFFLSSYRRGQEAETYFSHVCTRCAETLVEAYGLG